MQSRVRVYVVWIALFACGALAAPASAGAQNKQIEASFQGAVGLGLVGAELGAVIPALAGVESTWAYVVCPAIGAAGGAIAGYFALDRPDHVELSIGALTLGMALVIPALVVTLSATAYDAGDVSSARVQPVRGAGLAQARATSRTPPSAAHRRSSGGMGMLRVDLDEGELALAAPAVALVPGIRARGDFHVDGMSVALMSGRF